MKNNDERHAHIQHLCLSGKAEVAEALVFEWVRTSVFSKADFLVFLAFLKR